MPKTFKIALISQQMTNEINTNLENSIQNIQLAASNGANIVVLPELHASKYFCQTKDQANFAMAETIPGPISEKLAVVADKLNILIVASIFEKHNGQHFNTAIIIGNDGSIIHKYRKLHIPSCTEYNESFYFEKGDLGYPVAKTIYGNIGLLICYDQWFPEAARSLALNGAEIIIIPTAIGYNLLDPDSTKQKELDAWKIIQRSHAIANNIHIATCNRVGFESKTTNSNSGIEFWGNSFVCGPFVEYLSSSSEHETIIYADIDLTKNTAIKQAWPFLYERA